MQSRMRGKLFYLIQFLEATMKRVSQAIFISLLSMAGATFAQDTSGITESTDPARAADVERRAAEIQARQQSSDRDATSGDSNTTGKSMKRSSAKKKTMKSGRSKSENASGTSGGVSGQDSEAGGTSK